MNIYAGTLWLDSQKGELWITDPNWPDNGGGLFRATLDCASGTITGAQEVFSSKNGYAMHHLEKLGHLGERSTMSRINSPCSMM